MSYTNKVHCGHTNTCHCLWSSSLAFFMARNTDPWSQPLPDVDWSACLDCLAAAGTVSEHVLTCPASLTYNKWRAVISQTVSDSEVDKSIANVSKMPTLSKFSIYPEMPAGLGPVFTNLSRLLMSDHFPCVNDTCW